MTHQPRLAEMDPTRFALFGQRSHLSSVIARCHGPKASHISLVRGIRSASYDIDTRQDHTNVPSRGACAPCLVTHSRNTRWVVFSVVGRSRDRHACGWSVGCSGNHPTTQTLGDHPTTPRDGNSISNCEMGKCVCRVSGPSNLAFLTRPLNFEVAAGEENRDEAQRAEALMKTGACYYHLRNYGKCFQVMRDVIDQFPGSDVVNDAWHYIGLGHFQLGHYGRAIAALENVGTAVTSEDGTVEKLEAGKRLFVRIDDADLAILEPQQAIDVLCEVASGDSETIQCFPLSRNARLAIGSVPTQLGTPDPENGRLEIRGDDTVTVSYLDEHNARTLVDRTVVQKVEVAGTADLRITDGAFRESLMGVVLGKELNLQVNDGDRDLTDGADTVEAVAIVYRPRTEENGEDTTVTTNAATAAEQESVEEGAESDATIVVDRRKVVLVEVHPPQRLDEGLGQADGAPTADEQEGSSVHSGLFRASIPLQKAAESVEDDDSLQALSDDVVEIVYLDQRHRGEGTREVTARARCLEGNIGAVRISR